MPHTTHKSLAEQIGEFVREKRTLKGWTQEKLSEEAFGTLNKARISCLESSKKGATIHTLEAVLNALGASIIFKED